MDLRWMPQNLINEKSILVHVMVWRHQATTQANINVDLWCNIASLGHSELMLLYLKCMHDTELHWQKIEHQPI